MRGDSYLFGMRGLCHYGCIPEDEGQFLLYSINGDNDLKRCFAEEDFHEIIDFNDLPNSLFACNVHQSVFEDEDSKSNYGKILPVLAFCGRVLLWSLEGTCYLKKPGWVGNLSWERTIQSCLTLCAEGGMPARSMDCDVSMLVACGVDVEIFANQEVKIGVTRKDFHPDKNIQQILQVTGNSNLGIRRFLGINIKLGWLKMQLRAINYADD